MAKGRVVIDEQHCKGCGYCVEFCPKGCLVIDGVKFTSQGYLLPSSSHPEKCTGCALCGWMCPSMCIEVYKEA